LEKCEPLSGSEHGEKIPGYLKVFGGSALLFIDVKTLKRCDYVVLKIKLSTKVEQAYLLHIMLYHHMKGEKIMDGCYILLKQNTETK